MTLPEGPGVAVSVDYFGPLPVTPRGKIYILLFTDRLSRRDDMFPVTAAELTVEGTANILVNKYIPLSGCPRTMLSDNGLKFCSKLSQAAFLFFSHTFTFQFLDSRGHRCRPFSPPVLAFNVYRA